MNATQQTHFTIEDIASLTSISFRSELEALIARLEIQPLKVYSRADVRQIIRETQKEN
jgi:hypothetical protein